LKSRISAREFQLCTPVTAILPDDFTVGVRNVADADGSTMFCEWSRTISAHLYDDEQ